MLLCRGGFLDIICALFEVLYKPHFESYRNLPKATCLVGVLALPESFSVWLRSRFSFGEAREKDSFRPEFLSECASYEEFARAVLATGSLPAFSSGLWTNSQPARGKRSRGTRGYGTAAIFSRVRCRA